jgi:hypothetical protein
MGGGVGLTIGFIFGSWSILRFAYFFKNIQALFCSLALGAELVHAGSWGHFRNTCSVVRPHFHFSWPLDLYVVHLRTLSSDNF